MSNNSQKMTFPKMIQVAGLVCLSALFIYEAVVILKEPERNADKMFKQYADFRIWSNKAQRSYMGGKTLFEFPSSELVKPYKLKATYIISYINLLGAVGMIVGEQSMIIPLAIAHLLQSFMKNNHFPLNQVAQQVKYDNNKRQLIADMIIFFALLIVMPETHPLAGGPAKSTKIKKN